MQSRFRVHIRILYTYTPPHDNCICARYKISFFFSPQSRRRRRDSHPTPTKRVNTAVTSAISVAGRTLCARVRERRTYRLARQPCTRHEPSSSPRSRVSAEKNKLLSERFTVENVVQEFNPAGDRYVNAKITDNNVHLYGVGGGGGRWILEKAWPRRQDFGFPVERRTSKSDFSRF